MRDECGHLCTGRPLNSKGYLMFTNQAQVWTLENTTQYFFFFDDTLELSFTFGFGWHFIQRKIGIHVTLFK